MIVYETLPLVGVGDVDELASPTERSDVTLDSPATSVFTSFSERPPVVVEETTSLDDAIATLQRAQALGDYFSLESHGRRVVRIHLGENVEGALATLSML